MGNTTARMLRRLQAAGVDLDAQAERALVAFDLDRDDCLSPSEFDALLDGVGTHLATELAPYADKLDLTDLATPIITAAVKNERADHFAKADADGDGMVSLTDLRARLHGLLGPATGPAKRNSTVFDRLTDPHQYTGSHAQPPEATVEKRGDGAKTHATGHARNFGDAPVQKFGLQVEAPRHVLCWNGLDKHALPHKVLLSSVRTFDQLVSKCSQACSVSPQPLFLHTPDGHPSRPSTVWRPESTTS
eukprot:TRINITY_DN3032_c0_g1_i1.p2 TRINITY_DN3032_c0_g1~~TRINITY_DN3032_c0_g1_i1.p2  ORF type:complete len:257 (+),score=70.15 TRINITY_DN3032_c0_g1_i1:31-771(+)